MQKVKQLLNKLWQRIKSSPIVVKAFHTFWQAFLATFVLGVPLVVYVLHAKGLGEAERAAISLAGASLAAALSATKTYLVSWWRNLVNTDKLD